MERKNFFSFFFFLLFSPFFCSRVVFFFFFSFSSKEPQRKYQRDCDGNIISCESCNNRIKKWGRLENQKIASAYHDTNAAYHGGDKIRDVKRRGGKENGRKRKRQHSSCITYCNNAQKTSACDVLPRVSLCMRIVFFFFFFHPFYFFFPFFPTYSCSTFKAISRFAAVQKGESFITRDNRKRNYVHHSEV